MALSYGEASGSLPNANVDVEKGGDVTWAAELQIQHIYIYLYIYILYNIYIYYILYIYKYTFVYTFIFKFV